MTCKLTCGQFRWSLICQLIFVLKSCSHMEKKSAVLNSLPPPTTSRFTASWRPQNSPCPYLQISLSLPPPPTHTHTHTAYTHGFKLQPSALFLVLSVTVCFPLYVWMQMYVWDAYCLCLWLADRPAACWPWWSTWSRSATKGCRWVTNWLHCTPENWTLLLPKHSARCLYLKGELKVYHAYSADAGMLQICQVLKVNLLSTRFVSPGTCSIIRIPFVSSCSVWPCTLSFGIVLFM